MKILEPFAGYKLASGHPFMHMAMFCASFFVNDAPAQELTGT